MWVFFYRPAWTGLKRILEMFTVNDIIYAPEHEGVESLVGKKVFFGYRIKELLEEANSNSDSYKGVLKEVTNKGFLIEGFSSEWEMIIPAPENKPRPFKSLEEFSDSYARIYDGIGISDQLKLRGGYWLECARSDGEFDLVVKMDISGLSLDGVFYDWKEIFSLYRMPDGSVCGMED